MAHQVLRSLGAVICENCRQNDLAARYGGEEFSIILPETALDSAVVHGERLRKAVMNQGFNLGADETRIGITVSVGLAAVDESMTEPEHLIEAADQALYRAKQNGRNQIAWHVNKVQSERRETA